MDKFEANKNIINKIDITTEYFKIFDLAREKFALMVKNQDFTDISSVFSQYKLNKNDLLDSNFFSSERLEDYLVADSEGKITIAGEKYSFPPFMFEIVHVLVKRVILQCVRESFDKYYVEDNSSRTKEQDKVQNFLDYKLTYFRKLAKERKSHIEITKVKTSSRTPSSDHTSYEREEFTFPINSFEEYITNVISSSILIAWFDYQRVNALKDFEVSNRLFN